MARFIGGRFPGGTRFSVLELGMFAFGKPRISSLIYHDVVDEDEKSGFEGAGPESYKLSRRSFREHLEAMSAAAPGVPPFIGDPLLLAEHSPGKVRWLLTFDDGGVSALHIADELEARGWRAYFFVVTSLIGRPGFMTKGHLRELSGRGHLLGSHSDTHPKVLSSLSRQGVLDEWARSKVKLSEALGVDIVSASVPGGYYSRMVGEAAGLAGLNVLFTSEPTRKPVYQNGLLLVGRFSIKRSSRSSTAFKLVRGDVAPEVWQRLVWSGKGIAKRVLGRSWMGLRNVLIKRISSESRRI